MKEYYVYILECNDNTLYTGYTTDPKRRLKEHNARIASKYTRGRTPVKMIYLEQLSSLSHALKREIEIKSMSRIEKLELIDNQNEVENEQSNN